MAEEYGINYVTLLRYVRKSQNSPSEFSWISYAKQKQVFSAEQEQAMSDYLKRASSIYFGLTPIDVRKLALQYSVKLNLSVPMS